MPTMRTALAATGAALALATTGCGYASAPSHHRASSPTDSEAKADFLRDGNAILCTKSRKVIGAVTGAVLSGDEQQAATDVVPVLRDAYEGLAHLDPPRGDGRVAPLLRDMRRAVETVEADPRLVDSDADPFEDVDRDLARYGLDGCD
jgi:hypothetical protein